MDKKRKALYDHQKAYYEKIYEEIKQLPKELQKMKITLERQRRRIVINWPDPEQPELTPWQLYERAIKKLDGEENV